MKQSMIALIALAIALITGMIFGALAFLAITIGFGMAMLILFVRFRLMLKKSERLIKEQDVKVEGSFYEEEKGEEEPQDDNQLIEESDNSNKEGAKTQEALSPPPLPLKSQGEVIEDENK